MGKRLIDAELLTKQFLTRYTEREKQGNYTFVACEIKQDFADLMDEIPTVDAVELPLKVGHIVYHQFARWEREVDIRPFQVTSMSISQNKKGEWKKSFRISWLDGDKTRDPWYDYSFDYIGKTVFFTKEEAEKAWEVILAERNGNENV